MQWHQQYQSRIVGTAFHLNIHNFSCRRVTNQQSEGVRNRHGSAELGSTARERERDRARDQRSIAAQSTTTTTARPVVGDANAQARAYRTQRAGPQEAEEWASALDNVVDLLISIENMQRKQSEQLSKHKEALEHDTERAIWLKKHVVNCYEKVNNHHTE